MRKIATCDGMEITRGIETNSIFDRLRAGNKAPMEYGLRHLTGGPSISANHLN
jgi:hypothetical protein